MKAPLGFLTSWESRLLVSVAGFLVLSWHTLSGRHGTQWIFAVWAGLVALLWIISRVEGDELVNDQGESEDVRQL